MQITRYGILPTEIIQTAELDLVQKGILAFLWASAGGGNTVVMRRSEILTRLPVSRNTFRERMQDIIQRNWVEMQPTGSGNYLFVLTGKGPTIRLSPAIMANPNLSLKSKVLYVFLSARAERSQVDCSIPQICESLGISSALAHRLLNQLLALNYIAALRAKTHGPHQTLFLPETISTLAVPNAFINI